jgi:hypothetical protein
MVNLLSVEFGINLVCFVLTVYSILRYNFYYTDVDNPDDTSHSYLVMQKIMDDPLIKPIVILGLTGGFQFARVFFVFKASKTLGPMITIIMNMIANLCKFVIILIIIMFTFSSIGQMFFFDVPEFSTEDNSLIFLMSASLGNFNYHTFEGNFTLNKYYGYAYLTIYLLFTNVTLLNFLIAILSSTYDVLSTKSNALYLKQIVTIKHTLDNHKHYSSLPSSYIPAIFFTLPFSPFLIFK